MARSLVGVSVGWLGISMVADGVPTLLLPHQLLASGDGSATSLGAITLGAIVIAAAIQPGAGAWSDRAGGVPVIGAGVVVCAVGLGLLAAGMPLPGAVVALLGASVAQAGYQRLLPDRISPDRRGRGAGLKGLFDLAGAFVAFSVLGGLLAAGLTTLVALFLVAGLAGSLALGLALAARPRAGGVAATSERDSAVSDGRLAAVIVARFLFLLGVYVVGRFLTLYVADRTGLDADAATGEAGTLLAVLALVTAVAAVPAGWLVDRLGRRPMVFVGGTVAAAGIGALSMAGSTDLMLASGVLMALGTAAFGAGSWAAVADLSTASGTGRRMGFANWATAGAAAAAGLFGPLIDFGNRAGSTAGYSAAFAIAATAAVAGGFVAWRASPDKGPPNLQEVAI